MVQITLIPVISLWMKLRSIFREIIRVKCVQKVTEAQNIIAGHLNRRRNSIYTLDETIAMAKRQQKSIPYKIRLGLVVYNILYRIFLLKTLWSSISPDNRNRKYMLCQGIVEWLPCENAVLWKGV